MFASSVQHYKRKLGDNSEIGGDVKGDYVRWNFFLDATVFINDELWVEGGRLVKY